MLKSHLHKSIYSALYGESIIDNINNDGLGHVKFIPRGEHRPSSFQLHMRHPTYWDHG